MTEMGYDILQHVKFMGLHPGQGQTYLAVKQNPT